jgi:hypothetical protein
LNHIKKGLKKPEFTADIKNIPPEKLQPKQFLDKELEFKIEKNIIFYYVSFTIFFLYSFEISVKFSIFW